MVILTLMLVSCTYEEQEFESETKTILISAIPNGYEVEDFTEFGLYVLTVNDEALKGKLPVREMYCLEISSGRYELRRNPLDASLLMAFLPENFEMTGFDQSRITLETMTDMMQKRADGDLSIECVYITKEGQLYELTLIDYLFLKAAKHTFILDDGKLLRPTHVKTNEGYAYSIQRYYDARQAAADHTVNGAFAFLKAQADHKSLVNTENPNRLKIENGDPVASDPDTRDRVWQLGEMGTIDTAATYTYDVVDDNVANLTLMIKESNLPEIYKGYRQYEIQLKGDATICYLRETESGIFESVIPYTTTSSVELVRNARFATVPFEDGDGTLDNPYQIADWKQLAAINDEPEYLEAHYVLIADLASDTAYYDEYAASTSNGNTGWLPVGDYDNKFAGSFSGKYEGIRYTIRDFVISRNVDYTGLRMDPLKNAV